MLTPKKLQITFKNLPQLIYRSCYFSIFYIQQTMKSKKQQPQQNQTDANQQTYLNSNTTQQQQQRINTAPESSSATPQQYTFGSAPISIKCPFCKHRTKTQIIMKPQLISIMLALVLFSIIPNAVMIVAIVIIMQVTATKRHRCSLCERQLGTDGKFLAVFTDRVYSFSIGENGLLVSKKILMTIGLFFTTILIVYIRSRIEHTHQWVDFSWPQLIQKCPASSSQTCNSDNIQKTIKNWKGYVMRVEDRRQSMRRYYDYAIQLYIKMQPSQKDNKTPDLYLTCSSSGIFQFGQVLDQLSHGDQIVFNGTFLQPGGGLANTANNRHLQLVGLSRTGVKNSNIEIFMTKKQQDYFNKNVEGKALRQQKKQK